MSLLVVKFGGSSLRSIERIVAVAKIIADLHRQGNGVAVVLSAMGGKTDELDAMAKALNANPNTRELDALLATGERISTSLMAMALDTFGVKAKSMSGQQAGVITNDIHGHASIQHIDRERYDIMLQLGQVPILAGFQGVDCNGNVTTLGRGGSDLSAVALAEVLKADECRIYTDVKGVHTTDPMLVDEARLIRRITFEEMFELASLGARVMQPEALELAGRHQIPLRIMSSFEEDQGTLISYEVKAVDNATISGVTYDRHQAMLSITGLPEGGDHLVRVVEALSEASIKIDMIVQTKPSEQHSDISFTVARADYFQAMSVIKDMCAGETNAKCFGDNGVAKVSIVGMGMRAHAAEVAARLFRSLSDVHIQPRMVGTSEIRLSIVIDEKYLELGVRTVHHAFALDAEAVVSHEEAHADKLDAEQV